MQVYKTETTLTKDGVLTLSELPFRAGDRVEVIVLACSPSSPESAPYPLRGQPIHYDRPLEPVAPEDWEAMQ